MTKRLVSIIIDNEYYYQKGQMPSNMHQDSGVRKTRQRYAILEELRKVTCHPTADELYNIVRRRLPHISMGTVYRNLELLAKDGVIQKLEISGTQKRFDGNVRNHYHMRCVGCGEVADANVKKTIRIESIVKEVTDFKVIGHRLELIGICPQCIDKKTDCRRSRSEGESERGKGRKEKGKADKRKGKAKKGEEKGKEKLRREKKRGEEDRRKRESGKEEQEKGSMAGGKQKRTF